MIVLAPGDSGLNIPHNVTAKITKPTFKANLPLMFFPPVDSYSQPHNRMKPPLTSAWQVSPTPKSTMNADEVKGSQRVTIRPSP